MFEALRVEIVLLRIIVLKPHVSSDLYPIKSFVAAVASPCNALKLWKHDLYAKWQRRVALPVFPNIQSTAIKHLVYLGPQIHGKHKHGRKRLQA